MQVNADKQIEQEIHAFAGFKTHFTIFGIAMILLWLGWFAGGGALDIDSWPIYLSSGWGLIIIVHFFIAYRTFRQRRKNTVL